MKILYLLFALVATGMTIVSCGSDDISKDNSKVINKNKNMHSASMPEED